MGKGGTDFYIHEMQVTFLTLICQGDISKWPIESECLDLFNKQCGQVWMVCCI